MDFFAQQDDARRRTRWLVVFFILAILGISAVLYGLFWFSQGYVAGSSGLDPLLMLRDFGVTAGVTGGFIFLGSLFKLSQLRGGGPVVARELGGREVDPSTIDGEERRLLNIVEEMSIASGIPAPGVWVMDREDGINAFAAGHDPSDAVIGVTRGALRELSRDELQGVVAHEFSHILNGDMRLNMRLIGWIFGIVMLALMGRGIMNVLRYSGGSRNREGQQVQIAIFVAGLAIFLVGSLGEFFARLIQAAISRQREFLADASAVQFTRNPDGLKGALMRIAGYSKGGKLDSPMSGEASHMFFSGSGLFSWGLATHPPIEQRIKALDPSWDGQGKRARRPRKGKGSRASEASMGFAGETTAAEATAAFDQLGHSESHDVAVGEQIYSQLNPKWVEMAHSRDGARTLIYGLLLSSDGAIEAGEVSYLQKTIGSARTEQALDWHRTVGAEHSAIKIALVDVAIAALRRLTLMEYEEFRAITHWMMASDSRIDLFEFMLQRMVRRHLDYAFGVSSEPKRRWAELPKLSPQVSMLVSALAGLSQASDHAFAAGAAAYQQQAPGATLRKVEQLDLGDLEKVLEECERTPMTVRREILQICVVAVTADSIVESQEMELLRAIADSIGVSVPPFVAAGVAG